MYVFFFRTFLARLSIKELLLLCKFALANAFEANKIIVAEDFFARPTLNARL